MQSVQCRLCSQDDEIALVKSIQCQLRDAERRLAEGQEDLFHLQKLQTIVACDDHGLAIGAQLVLPILQVGCAWFDELCLKRTCYSSRWTAWSGAPPTPRWVHCSALALQGRRRRDPSAVVCRPAVPEDPARVQSAGQCGLQQACSPPGERAPASAAGAPGV